MITLLVLIIAIIVTVVSLVLGVGIFLLPIIDVGFAIWILWLIFRKKEN